MENAVDNTVDMEVETPTEEVADVVVEEAATDEVVTEDAPAPEVEAPFPKKAVNAIERRDRQLNKLKAENRRIQELLNNQAPQEAPKQESIAPNEDDFDTYGEYLAAVNKFDMDIRFAEYEKKQGEGQQEAQRNAQEAQWMQERETAVYEQATKAAEEIADYQDVFNANIDIVDNYSPEVQRVFLESDSAAYAFYQMAQEGTLESLIGMTPTQAAMAIGQASARYASAPAQPVQKVSKAPAPMKGNTGTGDTSKNPATMSPDALMEWVGN